MDKLSRLRNFIKRVFKFKKPMFFCQVLYIGNFQVFNFHRYIITYQKGSDKTAYISLVI